MSEIFEREEEYGNSLGRVNLTGYNGTQWVALRADSSTRSLTVIDYPHYEVHAGSSFYIKDYVSLAANATSHMMFTTGDKEAHWEFVLSSEAEAEVNIYEDANGTTGSSILILNSNRNSATTNTVLANAISTVTTAGVLTMSTRTGSGKISGGGANGLYEVIAKTNSKYIIRFKNLDGTATRYIDYLFRWYEHTPKSIGG